MSIAKNYEPTQTEDKWYQHWLDQGYFHSAPDEREPYTIVIPPPNVTGMLHMGHMLNNTIQDVLIRRKRMQGYNACWVPGTDHASIATEAKVVSMLRERGIDKNKLSRDEFLQYAWEWKEKYGGIILKQLRKLGASCDWNRTTFTMDDHYYRAVIKVFVDLFDKGHIYRGARMINWDPQGKTALSDEEVNYKEVDGNLYYVRYPIQELDGEFITIATTRPETILGDTGIAVHPSDERYQHLLGKHALVPLINRPVPVVADDYIDKEFGTGCLKVTPAHDINDYEIGQRHNLEAIDVLNEDGTMSEAAGMYIGQDRFVVRKQIVKDLDAAGFLVKTEPIRHNVGFSERTDAVVEPRISTQWFLNMEELVKPALEHVENGDIQLVPEKFINTYRHWINNIRDWCISRQLMWGQRIPAWYLKDGSYVVAEDAESAVLKAREKSGNANLQANDLRQDEDVLDTWFSSWLWPIEVFNGFTDPGNKEIEYYYPTNDLVTAPEILFFWVARMIVAGYEYKDEKPFSNVYLTGIVRDKLRRKMSKQLGNSPDPLDLIEKYGADGVRVGMLFSSPAGNDLLFDEELVEQGRNFANKVWNAYRLVKSWDGNHGEIRANEQLAIDWMDERIREVRQEIDGQFEQFRISEALMSSYKLTWDDFCSWYLEMVKPPYGEGLHPEVIDKTIGHFEEVLKILHPFMPFITEEIWHGLREREEGDDVVIAALSGGEEVPDQQMLKEMTEIQEIVKAVRNFRTEKQIAQKEQLELLVQSDQKQLFQKYAAVLQKLLNLSRVEAIEAAPEQAAKLVVKTHELYIPLQAEAMDIEGEISRLKKEMEYTEGFLKSVEKKLSNERFVANAPAEVVDKEKKKQSDAQERLKVLKDSLAAFEQLK